MPRTSVLSVAKRNHFGRLKTVGKSNSGEVWSWQHRSRVHQLWLRYQAWLIQVQLSPPHQKLLVRLNLWSFKFMHNAPKVKKGVVEEQTTDRDEKQRNEMWELVQLPQRKKVIGVMWLYTPKFNANGTLEKLKARMVAKGYTQSYWIDFFEIFTHVAKFNILRILIVLAT